MATAKRDVAVLYNSNVRAMIAGLMAGDFLEKVAHQRVMVDLDDESALASIFHLFNQYPPPNHRSLSVGDVVTLDGTSYACHPVGWYKLPEPVAQGKYERVANFSPKLIRHPGRVAVKRDHRGRARGIGPQDFQAESDCED